MNAEIGGIGKNKKKYEGVYHAVVTGVDDPEGLLRVQVRVYDLFDGVLDKDLPYAIYLLPVGARANDGFFVPAEVGDEVIIMFTNGDTRRPVIMGSAHFAPNSQPNLPHEAWGGPDKYTHERTSPQLTPTEAGSGDVVCTQGGVLIEIIQSTGEVRVTQKSSGSAAEIDKDGNITAHSEANLYGSSKVNTEIDVGADLEARVGGAVIIEAVGDVDITTDGNATVVVGAEATIEAPTKVTLTTPSLVVTGSVSAGGGIAAGGAAPVAGSISDSVGTMVAMRTVFNTHDHNENDSSPNPTNAPNQQM